MTTSGINSWVPSIAEIIDEAMEYAGIDPASANQRHLASAIRSFNQCFLWLENSYEALYRSDMESVTIRAGQPFFYAPDGTLSVQKGMLRKVGEPTSYSNNIEVLAKATWFDMPAKSQVGRPTIMALNFAQPISQDGLLTDSERMLDQPVVRGAYGEQGFGDLDWAGGHIAGAQYLPGSGPQIMLWPIPDQDYVLDYLRVRQTQKAEQLGENPDIRSIWILSITFYLGYLLAMKYNTARAGALKAEAEQQLDKTKMNNRETADVVVSVRSMSPARAPRRFR